MCGRYNIISDAQAWLTAFGLASEAANQIQSLAPNYNVAPTLTVSIVRKSGETNEREFAFVYWGLIPFWAKHTSIGYKLINARAETVAEKPAFRDAYRKRRCLIIANGFYEWQRLNGKKQPYLIRMKDQSPFAFAGLWESWRNPEDETELQSCSIITTEANTIMAPIHDRMPVILGGDDYDRWLEPNMDGESLLQPCPEEWLETCLVSTHVNSPRNNDSRCIERIEIN